MLWQLAEGYNPRAADPNGLLHAVARAFSDSSPPESSAIALAATGGTPQSTVVNTPFPQPLRAAATDAQGNPVAGVPVTFTTPATGPSALFGRERLVTLFTDAAGTVTSPALTATSAQGSYLVSATTPGAPQPAGFSLTNLPRRKK